MYGLKEICIKGRKRKLTSLAYEIYSAIKIDAIQNVEPDIDYAYQGEEENEQVYYSCLGNKDNNGIVYPVKLANLEIEDEGEDYNTQKEKRIWWELYFKEDPIQQYLEFEDLSLYYNIQVAILKTGDIIFLGEWKEWEEK